MSDMRKLLESMTKFAGEPEQKPGDQVRGTEVAKKSKGGQHPFKNRLVGETSAGVTTSQLQQLSETTDDFSKFDKNIKEKLNLPRWCQTLDLFGTYTKRLREGVDSTELSDAERALFDEFDRFTSTSDISSARVGDKVALLQLKTQQVPGMKTFATIQGFTSPKEIRAIENVEGYQQFIFADGRKYPDTEAAPMWLAQSWASTKLFSNNDAAERASEFFLMKGNHISKDLQLTVNIDTSDNNVIKELAFTANSIEHKLKESYKAFKQIPDQKPGEDYIDPPEADYDGEYQATVLRVRDKAKKQEQEKLARKRLKTDEDVLEHCKQIAKQLRLTEGSNSHLNAHQVLAGAVFLRTDSLLENQQIASGEKFLKQFDQVDEFKNMNVGVGSKAAIVDAQLSMGHVELTGFAEPKTITKIYRDESEDITHFEFNNDPDDVWPRVDRAEFKGKFITHSAFFPTSQALHVAMTMLLTGVPEGLAIRNRIRGFSQQLDEYGAVPVTPSTPSAPTATTGAATTANAAAQTNTVDPQQALQAATLQKSMSNLKSIDPTLNTQAATSAIVKTSQDPAAQTNSAETLQAKNIAGQVGKAMTDPRLSQQLNTILRQASR